MVAPGYRRSALAQSVIERCRPAITIATELFIGRR
jgi:hypothetical protein